MQLFKIMILGVLLGEAVKGNEDKMKPLNLSVKEYLASPAEKLRGRDWIDMDGGADDIYTIYDVKKEHDVDSSGIEKDTLTLSCKKSGWLFDQYITAIYSKESIPSSVLIKYNMHIRKHLEQPTRIVLTVTMTALLHCLCLQIGR